MMMSKTRWTILSAACLAGGAYAFQASQKLFFNGSVASSDVRMIAGKAYVPLADVAKAMDMQIVKKDGGYELIRTGGAGQIANNYTGKIGEEVFTGKWRFTVLEFSRAQSYDMVWSTQYTKHIDADSNGELIIVTCRIKNGTKVKDELVFSSSWEGCNNALTTSSEESIPPAAFDVKETETAPVGVSFLPGAAINFKMIFKVPKGTEPKDVIFTAMRYSMRSGSDLKKDPPQDIRVSLVK